MGTRTPKQLKDHYDIEKALARRLMSATEGERRTLYGEVYDELFRSVPDHPQLTKKAAGQQDHRACRNHWRILSRFLHPDSTFLEVGIGDGRTSFMVAGRVAKVFGVDVSAEIANNPEAPANFELVLSNGVDLGVPDGCVDVAFSNQLMEHLHPDDAAEQLANIVKALKPGGVYVCLTPHRFSGPHDISRHFSDTAEGFHLKEYTLGELSALFLGAGFSSIYALVGARGLVLPCPLWPLVMMEARIARVRPRLRRMLFFKSPLRLLNLIHMVGRKAG